MLVLDAGAAGRPFTVEFTSALSLAFDAHAEHRPGVFFEWLDRDRFDTPQHLDTVRRYLGAKYATSSAASGRRAR